MSHLFTSTDYYLLYGDKIDDLLAKEKTYDKEDFTEIVQVLDTDGCFIDDECVFEDSSLKHIIYKANSIYTPNLSSYRTERINKHNNIKHLLINNEIRLFYNSTNIDHAFDNLQNPSRSQKLLYSIKMYNEFKNDGEALLDKLVSICPTLEGYDKSWTYIQEDCNSLKSCSNILYFVTFSSESQ